MTPTTRRSAIAITGLAAVSLLAADLAGWLDGDLPALAKAYRQALPGIDGLVRQPDPRLDALAVLDPAERRRRLLAWIGEDAAAGRIRHADGWPVAEIEAALAARF
jgi:hypothetical protein